MTFELTLLGPGYGESLVLHLGGGMWVLVDSCLDSDGFPQALRYLESIDVDPAEAVDLIVATHWHDDHIRGIADLVETCKKATFCCGAVLCQEEFLAVAHALEGSHLSVAGSGVRGDSRCILAIGAKGFKTSAGTRKPSYFFPWRV